MTLPSELAEIAGATQGWLTRIDVTRQIDRVVADTKMVRSADSAVVEMPSILREQRVLIASACCPAGTIPDAPRSFVVERIYPVDDPPSTDTLFYCARPPEPSQCDGVPDRLRLRWWTRASGTLRPTRPTPGRSSAAAGIRAHRPPRRLPRMRARLHPRQPPGAEDAVEADAASAASVARGSAR